MSGDPEYIAWVEAEYGPVNIPEDEQRTILAAVWALRSEIRAEITALTQNQYGDWTDGDWHHRDIARALREVEAIAIGDLDKERTAAQDYAREQQEAARKSSTPVRQPT